MIRLDSIIQDLIGPDKIEILITSAVGETIAITDCSNAAEKAVLLTIAMLKPLITCRTCRTVLSDENFGSLIDGMGVAGGTGGMPPA